MYICSECGSRGGDDDGVMVATVAADAPMLAIWCRSCVADMRLGAKVLHDRLAEASVGDERWSDLVIG